MGADGVVSLGAARLREHLPAAQMSAGLNAMGPPGRPRGPGNRAPCRRSGDVPEVSTESRRRRPAQTCRPWNLGPRPRPGLTCSSGTPAAHPFRGSGPLRIFQVRSSGPGCNRRKPCSGCYPLPPPPDRAEPSGGKRPHRPPSVRVPVMLSPPQPCPPLHNHRFP